MEKSDLSTDSENMEYIKVSDGDCPLKEQNFCNKVLGGVDCSRNEKEKSSESKGEKNPKVEEKQMISDDYPKKNVELVREEFSEATSTESKLLQSFPETKQNHKEVAPETDLSENTNIYSNLNTSTEFGKAALRLHNDEHVSNVKSKNTEERENSSEQAQPIMDDLIQNSDLPEVIEDPEFSNRLKVFHNYRNFGAMYSAKKNFKKAEWAFKNGIKQTAGQPARSKEQLRSILVTEVEFRLDRARYG